MQIVRNILFFFSMILLASCGGGGGGGGGAAIGSVSILSAFSSTSAISSTFSSSSTISSASSASFLVTTKSNLGGSIGPASSVVLQNNTSDFSITPENGYKIAQVSGCNGTLTGNVFTTANILSDCVIEATFTLDITDVPEAPRVLAYVVEKNAYDALGDLLVQFTTVVAADTHSTTKIITVDSTAKPTEIRKSLQAIDNLWGVFLIGDIPPSLLNVSNVPASISKRIDDEYFRLLKCSQFVQLDDFNFSIPDNGSYLWNDPDCRHGNWVSRIIGRSPGRTDDVVAFIKKDIDLRHSSMWSPVFSWQSLAWFGDTRQIYAQTSQALYPNLSPLYVDSPLYNVNQVTQVDVPGHSAQDMLQYFKNCVTSLTEICEAVVHGNGSGLDIEGQGIMGVLYSSDSTWVDSNTIASWSIKAKVINLISCGPGDFLQGSFFAGTLLSNGNTLLITTPTQEVFVSTTFVDKQAVTEHPSLGMGASFAEVDPLDSSPWHYFGDPTITLRAKPQGDKPVMVINGSHFHFTNSVIPFGFPDSLHNGLVKSELRIGNAGTSDLKIRIALMQDHISVDRANPCGVGCGSSLAFNVADNLQWISSADELSAFPSYEIITIVPGAQRTIEFSFQPAVGTFSDGTTKTFYGSYAGSWFLVSNDPDNSRVWLDMSVKATP